VSRHSGPVGLDLAAHDAQRAQVGRPEQLALGRAQRVMVDAPTFPGRGQNSQIAGAIEQGLQPPGPPAAADPAPRGAGVHTRALDELLNSEVPHAAM